MTKKIVAVLFAASLVAACGAGTVSDFDEPERGNAEVVGGSSGAASSGGASSEGEGPR